MGKAMTARDLKFSAWGWLELNDVQWRREVRGWMCHKCKELEGGGGSVADLSRAAVELGGSVALNEGKTVQVSDGHLKSTTLIQIYSQFQKET